MSQKYCIFCGNAGLSKEHLWPGWIQNHVSLESHSKYISETRSSEGKGSEKIDNKMERTGNVLTVKFRVVCSKCNNEWMSSLEKSIKLFLVQIFEGKNIVFSKSEINELVRWAVMKIIVSEHSGNNTQVTPKEDRYLLRTSRIVPNYFRIYLGKNNTDNDFVYMRESVTLSSSESGPTLELGKLNRNTQVASFLIGPVFIFAIACREPEVKVWQYFKLNQLKCIFPSSRNQLRWKSLKNINQERMGEIVNSLKNLSMSSRVKYGGPLPK